MLPPGDGAELCGLPGGGGNGGPPGPWLKLVGPNLALAPAALLAAAAAALDEGVCLPPSDRSDD